MASPAAEAVRRLADGGEDLALDAVQRASYLEEHDGTFRACRYPACDSVLSILNIDLVGGPQVLRRDGPIWRWYGCARWRGLSW
jgi:hypothetical protein